MEFQHSNKNEARLQKIEAAIQQPVMSYAEFVSVSIEQQTLSDILKNLLLNTPDDRQEEVAIAVAKAVSAAFKMLNTQQKQ